MHTNRILTIAITAALSVPTVGHAGSQASGSFFNINQDMTKNSRKDTAAHNPVAASGHHSVDFIPLIKDVTDSTVVSTATPATEFGFDTNTYTAIISVLPNNKLTGGIVYARELFSSSPAKLPSGNNYAGVVYTIDGKIVEDFDMTFSLSEGAQFGDKPVLGIADSGGQWNKVLDPTSGGSNSNNAVFNITTSQNELITGDRLMLLYRIANSAALSEGKAIEMAVELKKEFGSKVNPKRTVQIATSTSAISTLDLVSKNEGTIYISVGDESKLFTTKDSDTTDTAYINSQIAQIGTLNITLSAAMSPDGVNPFKFGGSTEIATGGSKLDITGGQFAASKDSPGKVELVTINSGSAVTAKISDENTATFDLNDTHLQQIADDTDGAAIRIVVDQNTVINTVENPPQATLLIDFTESNLEDINPDPTDLRQIKKDGTVCVIYNVPNSGAQDKVNMRITNDSSIDGTITAKMYDKDGGAIGPPDGVTLNNGQELGAGKTIRLTATDLEAAGFPTWPGRAIMELTSTLPNLEIMNLLRNTAPGSPLTNLSYGASGSACSQ